MISLVHCATRLRLKLVDGELVDETLLKQSGSLGLVHKGNNVQVIYGPTVSTIRPELEGYIATIKK